MASQQPIDLITKAFHSIGTVAGGEPVPSDMANDALDTLNDLLDQWSNDKMLLYCVQEYIHEIVANDYVYTIGPGGDVGAVFTGSIAGDTLTVTALASGAISVGMLISGTGVTTGTAITSLGTALGGNGLNALGTYKVSIQQTIPPVTPLGAVATVAVTSGGADYATGGGFPTIAFAGGGGGVGAAATAIMRAVTQDATVGIGGTGYTVGDILTAVGGTFIRPAKWVVTVTGGLGAVNTVELIDGGQYTAYPAATFATTGPGVGCQLSTFWQVDSVVVTNGGSGYTLTPTATTVGGTPSVPAVLAPALGGVQTTIAMTASAPRPLRINSAFVRVVNAISGTLDYPVDVLHYEQYETIGIKTLPGPWPRALYYQPSEPLGVLNYWPNPSSGEMHLFCDTILNRFPTLTERIVFPQGYFMALMWSLAEVLIPSYPATGAALETRALIPEFAAKGRALIKRMNMQPQQVMRVDQAIRSRRGRDAGWILDGGFYP